MLAEFLWRDPVGRLVIGVPPGDLCARCFVTQVPEMCKKSSQVVLLRFAHLLDFGFDLLDCHNVIIPQRQEIRKSEKTERSDSARSRQRIRSSLLFASPIHSGSTYG